MWLDWLLRQPLWLPGATSNTNPMLVELASSSKALGFCEIKAFGWRTVPTEIDAVCGTNKQSACTV